MVPEGGVDRLTSAFCCHEYDCYVGVDTMELLPPQGRVVVTPMDMGTPGVVNMRWTAHERNPQEGLGKDLIPAAGVDDVSHLAL